MELFKGSGGRLFRIALLFTFVAVGAMLLMSYFTYRAMEDVKEIATTAVAEGETLPDMRTFYTQLIDNLKLGTVISSLAGVLIAVAARYGLRETAQNIGNGMAARTTPVARDDEAQYPTEGGSTHNER